MRRIGRHTRPRPETPLSRLADRFLRLSPIRKIIVCLLTVIVTLTMGTGVAAAAMIGVGSSHVHAGMDRGTARETLTYEGKRYVLNKNIVTFMFLGFDGRNKNGMDGQTDVIMVAAFDTKSGKATIITVPRDSMVSSPYYVGNVKLQDNMAMPICLSYAFAGGGDRGRAVVAQKVSEILGGVAIPYHYMLDYNGLPEINDAVGGVTLTPIQTIPDTSIEKGRQITLRGWESERYIRWRDHTTLQSPLDRQHRQVHYAKSFLAQAKHKFGRNVFSAVGTVNVAKKWSYTNTGSAELMYYAVTALGSDNLTDLPMVQLKGDLRRSGKHARFYLNRDAVRKVVVQTFYTPAQ
ncbi:LCP family protein [Bifidobacterium simiarum]|nr:LCP family protein [Bifidobacterium simiarum]MBT1165558.1 LCP family protein [Bifidobacterium simiarum]